MLLFVVEEILGFWPIKIQNAVFRKSFVTKRKVLLMFFIFFFVTIHLISSNGYSGNKMQEKKIGNVMIIINMSVALKIIAFEWVGHG